MTASTDNCIKLWDLRVGDASANPRPVRTFVGGKINQYTSSFEVSNCFRYLLSSDGRSVLVFDVGSGTIVDRTKNIIHGDTVTDVSFNPVFNEWASASIDGHCRVFRYPATKSKNSRHNPSGPVANQKIRL